MRKFIITAELRDITDQWDREEISYSRMQEILNEKALQYAKEYAKELEGSKLKEESEKTIISLMKENPAKVAQWMVLIFGRECVSANAQELELSEEADIDGNRYMIKTVITINKITPPQKQ